jgi:hypothetical protein
LVLSILAIVSAVIWIIAAVIVLVQENYPDGLYNFQRGILRWEARLLGYHASLVEQYRLALDTGPSPRRGVCVGGVQRESPRGVRHALQAVAPCMSLL